MRRVIRLGCGAAAALIVLLTCGQRTSAASDPPADPIQGPSACPEPRAVWTALTALVGGDRVETRLGALRGGPPPVTVTDLGTSFRIRAGDQAREYQDAPRDCGNRAKWAALFVALTLDSIEQTSQGKAGARPPSAAPPALPPEPGRPVPEKSVLVLDVGLDARIGVQPLTAAPGGLARLSWRRERYALLIGVRGSVPTDVTMAGVRVRQWRAGADLAARARWLEGRSVTPFLQLGVTAALLSVRAPDLATGDVQRTGELGFVLGGGVGFRRRPWGATFLLIEAEVDPAPPELTALPVGALGKAPHLWMGAAAGLSWGVL